jgi:hypothetical protein
MLTAQALDAEVLALLRRDPGLNPMARGTGIAARWTSQVV